jgi:hypothetical protein
MFINATGHDSLQVELGSAFVVIIQQHRLDLFPIKLIGRFISNKTFLNYVSHPYFHIPVRTLNLAFVV